MPSRPKGEDGAQTRFDGDLVYGVWKRTRSDGRKQVALVFRGTHTWGDWWSNARWITKWVPFTGWDQYDLARTVANHVTTELTKEGQALAEFKDAEFIVAGHSLGGGQAHQAGYAANAIKRVYSFNGSSVTGFYSVEKVQRDQNKEGMRVYRIGERGEILAILRGIMRVIYPVVEKNPKIVEVTYNFSTFANTVNPHTLLVLVALDYQMGPVYGMGSV